MRWVKLLPVLVAVFVVSQGGTTAWGSEPDLEKARVKVRALQAELQAVVASVAPAVGAVSNYHATFNEKTGRVGVRLHGFGSGTTITRSGLFLTNVHVVDEGARITVAFNDGNSYEAELFADTGSKGDIALLQLHGRKKWPFVDYHRGDAKRLVPGSFVFALGNPFGHALDGVPVLTLGIVSGKSRTVNQSKLNYVDSVQTDAEINPGNSGGPLFDSKGRFVGMNGMMRSTTRSSTGIGFAIPINQIREFIAPMMRRKKDLSYGYHGIRVGSVKTGAYVNDVDPGSPGAGAGLRNGDVIIRVNGKRIADATAFANIVGQLPEKKVVRLKYKRGKNTRSASFKLASPKDAPRQPKTEGQPLPLWERAYIGAEWNEDGAEVVFTRVIATAAAGRSKLATGDRLVRLGRTKIDSAAQLVRLLSFLEPGHKTRVAYKRDGRTREIGITLSDAAEAAGIVR